MMNLVISEIQEEHKHKYQQDEKKSINKLEEELDNKAREKIHNQDIIPDSQLMYFKKFRKLKKLKYWCNICKLGLYTKKNYDKHIVTCNYIEDNKTIQCSKENGVKEKISGEADKTDKEITHKIDKDQKDQSDQNQDKQHKTTPNTNTNHNNLLQKMKIVKRSGKKLIYKNKTIGDKSRVKAREEPSCDMVPVTHISPEANTTTNIQTNTPTKTQSTTQEKPTNDLLYSMLQDLMLKYNDMKTEFDEMKKYIQKTKKNISVLDYLNEQCDNTNIMLYSDWVQSLSITRNELIYMFECKYISGILNGLIKNLPLENTQTHCIKCFEQKKNIYFKYDVVICENEIVGNDKDTQEDNRSYRWQIMDEKDFNILIMKISQQFMKEFQLWKSDNRVKIEGNEEFYEVYMNYMKILLGGNHEKEKNNKDIKTRLYQYLKCDLKNLIQYEFTF